jgi:hypothetical protein
VWVGERLGDMMDLAFLALGGGLFLAFAAFAVFLRRV